ncbi:MAG: TonB-dependent receptor [Gammaproteobacteria bacterium]|nr:TonB-dependent receptor [Gammaproteobacteria bacterium]
MRNNYRNKLTPLTFLAVSSICLADNNTTDITEFSLDQLLNIEVFTASRFNQKSSEAPSKVTVINADAIRQYGYRTLKDVLNSMPGLYSTNDRNYSYLGVRGFGLAGDYNTRVLLLLDGQRVNENIYDSFGIDYEGIVNVDNISRVEFSSGPGSAIYGANAFFGVINIITKNASEVDGVTASINYASENSRTARITAANTVNNDLEVFISISQYKSDGADIYFAEFDAPDSNNGIAEQLDYEESNKLLLKLNYKDWKFETAYNDRIKGIPTASYDQAFNTPPSETTDTLGLMSLSYKTFISNESQIFSKLSYANYNYDGDFTYDSPPITINKDDSIGKWWNLDLRYQTSHIDKQKITLGIEYQNNYKQYQANFDTDPFVSYLDDTRSSEVYGIYIQDEIRLSTDFIINAGIRYDRNKMDSSSSNDNKQNIVNPRIAFIYSLQTATTLKLIYGTAYRNANAYELYYGEALDYLPSTNLQPEEIETYEFDIEHYFSNNLKLTTSLYTNETTNLIELNSDINGDIYYDNIGTVNAIGTDLEVEYISQSGLGLRSSYSYVETEIKSTGETLSNSPENSFKFNLTNPIFNKKANLGVELLYLSERITPQGDTVKGYSTTNLTISSHKLYDQLELSASIYNLFDKEYADPASEEHLQNSIIQDGRNYRVKLTYDF